MSQWAIREMHQLMHPNWIQGGKCKAKSQDMRMSCSRAVAADGSDFARERDAVSIPCVKGLTQGERLRDQIWGRPRP